MSKSKNKKASVKPKGLAEEKPELTVNEETLVNEAEVKQESVVEVSKKTSKPDEKSSKDAKGKKKKDKEKKPNRLVKKAKETVSELKKVTWPTFPKVVKQTGVVLAVVVVFAVVLLGFDYVLSLLLNLFRNA